MIPDAPAVDYVDLAWGDPNDDNLSQIFNYISTGTYGRIAPAERMMQNKSLRMSIPQTIHPLRFNGMVDYKRSGAFEAALKKLRQMHH
jgi:hypothetical protein